MQREVKKYLFDILKAISSIETFTKNINYYNDFIANDLVVKGVERSLEIIGEAMNKIIKFDSTLVINNSKNIIGLRNQIIHAYDNINYDIIWGIVKNHLPKLKIEVENLLNSSKTNPR